MTLAEFKAWFNGFTESMESNPTEKQWERIKARVAEIDDKPVTYPVFVDRYRSYWNGPYWVGGQIATAAGAASLQAYSNAASSVGAKYMGDDMGLKHHTPDGKTEYAQMFNGTAAMLDLGKAEYSSLAA